MSTTTPSTALGTAEATGLNPSQTSTNAKTQARLPFLTRLQLAIKIYLFKNIITLLVTLMKLSDRLLKSKPQPDPTYTKTYPIRPTLPNRIFIPSSHKPGQTHPLLLVIHGGGFAFMDPSIDDFFNRIMADTYGFVVVAVNYRKAPGSRFPIPVHDAAEISRAVLDDGDLPVDRAAKANLMGFSAGGNLALAIAQLPDVKERIGSIVPVYPVVDFTGKYKGAYRSTPDGKEDRLKSASAMFNWAYISPGQDQADKLLSPIYCDRRRDLPQRVWFVGAEYDYLCHEAEVMAKRLAFGDKGEGKQMGSEWEENGVKWTEVKDVVHGWTHEPAKGQEKEVKERELKKLQKNIAEWLLHDGGRIQLA